MKRWPWILLGATVMAVAIFLIKDSGRQQAPTKQIKGIIIPHHNLAGSLIDDSFNKVKKEINPGTIVIYGTNHYYPVSELFTTTKSVKDSYSLEDVLANDERVAHDHSIQTVIPYIKAYFPSAKIVPILVSTRYVNLEYLKKKTENFVNAFGASNVLYIASVDFAHNTSLSEGLKNNEESILSLASFNYQEIFSYDDEHMDSTTAIGTLLLTMQQIGANKWETWYSSHGGIVTGDFNLEGTSYVLGSFSN